MFYFFSATLFFFGCRRRKIFLSPDELWGPLHMPLDLIFSTTQGRTGGSRERALALEMEHVRQLGNAWRKCQLPVCFHPFKMYIFVCGWYYNRLEKYVCIIYKYMYWGHSLTFFPTKSVVRAEQHRPPLWSPARLQGFWGFPLHGAPVSTQWVEIW